MQMFSVFAAVAAALPALPASAQWSFNETFDGGFDNSWSLGGNVTPQVRFESVDGADVLRLENQLDSGERSRLFADTVLEGTQGVVEARFNTLTQDNTRIDGLFGLSLRNADQPGQGVRIYLFGGDFSTNRELTIQSAIDPLTTLASTQMGTPAYENDTWYRMQISSFGDVLTASLLSDDRDVLFSYTFSHSLADIGSRFEIRLQQFMGGPDGLFTDVAVDSVIAIPAPGSIAVLGVGAVIAVRRRR